MTSDVRDKTQRSRRGADEKPRKTRSNKNETAEERKIRKEKEKIHIKKESEEERAKRKRHEQETPEARLRRKEKQKSRNETQEERTKRKAKDRSESKKSSKGDKPKVEKGGGDRGYLKSTTARQLKEEEKIEHLDPYKDEDFATFEPDPSDPDEVYDEDFDDYNDDFEDIEFETKKEAEKRLEKTVATKVAKGPSPDEDWEAIASAIKHENSIAKVPKEVSERNLRESPVPVKKSESIFSLNGRKRRNRQIMDWKRAKELEKLVTLDVSAEIYFRSFPESDFTRFMRRLGANHQSCVGVGTDENQGTKETQTVDTQISSVWTQNQQSARSLNFSGQRESQIPKTMPLAQFERAVRLTECLLDEIDEEFAHESFSRSPNTGIRLSEVNAVDMDTDWVKAVVATQTEVKLYNLRQPDTPVWKMNLSGRKVKLWRNLTVVGTSFGSIVIIPPDKKVFTSDLIAGGHRAAIVDIIIDRDDIITADCLGGIRKWVINGNNIKLLKSIELDSGISSISADQARLFVAVIGSILVLSKGDFSKKLGIITTDLPSVELFCDIKSNTLVSLTINNIYLYDLKTLSVKEDLPESPRGCCVESGKLVYSTNKDLHQLDLSSMKSEHLGLKGCGQLHIGHTSSGMLLLAQTSHGVSIYNLSAT